MWYNIYVIGRKSRFNAVFIMNKSVDTQRGASIHEIRHLGEAD